MLIGHHSRQGYLYTRLGVLYHYSIFGLVIQFERLFVMEVNYKYVPENQSYEAKYRSDVISHAGRLLELVDAHTLIVGVDNYDVPFVFQISGRMVDALDIDMQEE